MFVCDIGCPRSPGKRTRKKTTPGATVRVTPDKIHSTPDAHSPGPRGSWSATSSTVRRATPTQEYNLSLSEMRHYKDEDTMVLILSQNSTPAEEAEYPVPLEQDTSELLDAEDDDTLAGYAEVASRLVKPSPLQLPITHEEDSTGRPARRLFYDDDVLHEEFSNHTYEADLPGVSDGAVKNDSPDNVRNSSRHARTSSEENTGFFEASQSSNGTHEWSPAKPIVHDQPWMADGQGSIQNDHVSSTNGSTGHSGSSSQSPGQNRSSAAETSQSRGRAFSPSGSKGNAWPKVHNGSIRTSPRAHNGATPGDMHGTTNVFQPSTSGPVRVSNGAGPYSSREERSEERRASGRDMRSHSPPQDSGQPEVQHTTELGNAAEGPRGFWDQREAHDGDLADMPLDSEGASKGTASDVQQSTNIGNGMPGGSSVHEPYSPADVRPFFSSQSPANTDSPVRRYQDEQVNAADPAESFFAVNPTLPRGYKASVPVHYPRRPVPKPPPGVKLSTDKSDRKESLHTEFPSKPKSPKQQGRQAQVTDSDEVQQEQGVDSLHGSEEQDPRTGSDKILESKDDHASRSFARAVSHSSLPSAMPEHSVRRGVSSQRNSAMRRSSRRDAHMQARIAKLDTSNLSHYSLPTLQRLAKDMGLSNYSRLSKSELVVQLVAEIILANMSLGWSVPEVAHGHLDEEEHEAHAEGEGPGSGLQQTTFHQSSTPPSAAQPAASQRPGAPGSGSPRTVYRFGDSYDSEDEHDMGSDVEVEPEVSPETVQRGRDMFSRLKQWLPKFGAAPVGEQGSSAVAGQGLSSGGQSSTARPLQRHIVSGGKNVALGGANVEQDFECLSALSMSQLQELCEDLGVEGWQRMRKYEMVGALLMDVYGLQH